MPQAVTLAPPEARRLAMARPIPVVPVTIATLFSNSFTEDRSLVSQLRSRSRGTSPPILDLGAKRFEECTPPGGNLETQDPLRTAMARAKAQSSNSELAYLKPSITPRNSASPFNRPI